jgi:hypothetical protein
MNYARMMFLKEFTAYKLELSKSASEEDNAIARSMSKFSWQLAEKFL